MPIRTAGGRPWTAWFTRLTAGGVVRTRLLSLIVGLVAFYVYWRTLAVSIAWGDSPELTAAAFQAGVPHPTGYPLYMLLGHAFIRLCPFGSVAYRMNLLSALCAAAAIALTYRLLWQVTRSRLASGLVALAFAFSQTFWAQAVIAEVYAFHLLGMVAVLSLVLAWEARGERRLLGAAALVYGLCFTHHLLSLLLAPGLLLFVLTSKRRAQFLGALGWTVPLFLLPLLLYLYLPWAAFRDPAMNWGDPRSWKNFLAHVTGEQYRGYMFERSSALILDHFRKYSGIGLSGSSGLLLAQFGAGLLWLAPIGLWSLARRHRRLLALTLLTYLITLGYGLNYNIYDVEVYYLPSHLMVALWIGVGLRQLGVWMGQLVRRVGMLARQRRPLNVAVGTTLLALPLSLLWTNWGVNDHHDDWSAITHARAALDLLKPNALLLSGDDNYHFPVMYARYVEKRRPDVILASFYDAVTPKRTRLLTRLSNDGLIVRPPSCCGQAPAREFFHPCLLKRIVDDNVGRRPVYILAPPTSLQFPWFAKILEPYYRVAPSNMACLEITRRPPDVAAANARPTRVARTRFGAQLAGGKPKGGLELLGWDIEQRWREAAPWLSVRYYWRVHDQALARSAAIWVVFTDANGNYEQGTDGMPQFHNIHNLAQGLGQSEPKLPSLVQETFELFVPPGQWNRNLRMRVAVRQGGKFLASSVSGSQWVDLGTVSTATEGGIPVALAAGHPERRAPGGG